jgi:hypothetical protein
MDASSCSLRPRSSRWFQISATTPFSKRKMFTPEKVAARPLWSASCRQGRDAQPRPEIVTDIVVGEELVDRIELSLPHASS